MEIVIKLIFAIISAVLTVVFIPYVRSLTTMSEREQLADAVKVAVQAAEQTLDGGKNKKTWVVSYLTKMGYTVDETLFAEELDALIESAVLELKKKEA